MVRAMAVSKLSVRYLETGRYLSMEELQKDEQFRQLAATAAVISEMDILVCDMDGHVLLSTDATMEGRPVTIPSSVMDKVSGQTAPGPGGAVWTRFIPASSLWAACPW